MIGKTVKGNGFGGVLRYVFDKPDAQYIGGNMASSTPRGLASEFRAIALHNRRVQRPVAHISLSPSPDEELSDLKALDFAQAYRTYLRSQEEAASRLSISRTKQRLILVVA